MLCFLLRPPGGGGSADRTLTRLLELPSPAAGSDLQADRGQNLEDKSSTGALFDALNSCKHTEETTTFRIIEGGSL